LHSRTVEWPRDPCFETRVPYYTRKGIYVSERQALRWTLAVLLAVVGALVAASLVSSAASGQEEPVEGDPPGAAVVDPVKQQMAEGALGPIGPGDQTPAPEKLDPTKLSRTAEVKEVKGHTEIVRDFITLEDGTQADAGSVLVTYEEGLDEAKKDKIKEKAKAKKVRVSIANLASGKDFESYEVDDARAVKEALEAEPGVARVSFNTFSDPEAWELGAAPNDPYYTRGDQDNVAPTRTRAAWDLGERGAGVRIAILDTGYNRNHEEFAGTKVVLARDFANGDLTPTECAGQGYGHGTHVASVASAATNNGVGIAGFAPSSRLMIARIAVLKSDNTCSLLTDLAIEALKWARANNASVANLSFGRRNADCDKDEPEFAALSRDLWANSGMSVVGAAGNDRDDGVVVNTYWPANCYGVVGVGATNETGTAIAPFSNFGDWVDVSAPGQDIWGAHASDPAGEIEYSGTSQAAPTVSGILALYHSKYPNATPNQARSRLANYANDRGVAGYDTQFGYGMVDAYDTVRFVNP
jgi:thermitase